MKRLLVLALICAFLMVTAATSFASDLSSYGYFRSTAQFQKSQDFNDNSNDESFAAEQRLRMYFEYESSENLKVVAGFEFDSVWGDTYGLAGDQSDDVLELKHAYVDFNLPNKPVNFKIGAQYMALPGIMYSSPVLGLDAPGIQMSTPINDNIDLNLGWVRALEDPVSSNGTRSGEADMFFATAPMDLNNETTFTPWAAYAYIGQDAMTTGSNTAYGDTFGSFSNGLQGFGTMSLGTLDSPAGEAYTDSVDAYWVGFHAKTEALKDMSLQAEGFYGSVEANKDVNDRSGYWFRGLADYTGLDNVTPSLFGFYSSGEDDDLSDGSETMPYFANDGYTTTQTGYVAGFNSHTNVGSYNYALMQYVPHAMWQVGLAAKNFSFVEKMSHTLAASYMRGTHSDDQTVVNALNPGEMTTEDSAWEVDFNTTYSIYENVDALLELGYAQVDMDESLWDDGYLDDPAYKCVTGIKYSF